MLASRSSRGSHPLSAPNFKRPPTQEPRFSCLPSLCLNFGNGVAKSSRREFNKKRLEVFLAGPVHPLPFEDVDAELAGAIRADLESIGKPIGAYDLLMAGQAMRNKLTLITANLSEFARIKALAWADWGKP